MAKGVPGGGGAAPLYPGTGTGEGGPGVGDLDRRRDSQESKVLEGPLAPLYRFWRPVLTADAAVAGLYFPWWQERAW